VGAILGASEVSAPDLRCSFTLGPMMRFLLIMWLACVLPAQTLRVYHVDVGQGHATLIVSPTGSTCLVDGGDSAAGSGVLLPLLGTLGIGFLDHVVLTHFHTDHWMGLAEVANAGVGIGTAWDRGNQNVGGGVSAYLAAVGNARSTILPGTVIDLGGGCTVTCICVNGQVLGGAFVDPSTGSQEENARSVGLKVRYGNYHEAIAGDLTGGGFGEPDVEALAAPVLGDVDVMVLNHHGSNTSNHQPWLDALLPEIGIIPVGNGNSFGHPHSEPLIRMLALPSTVGLYRLQMGSSNPGGVAVNGTLLIESDGSSYTVSGGSLIPATFTVDEGTGPQPTAGLIVGDVVVSEYMNNPLVVPDSDGEWLELMNTTQDPIDLAGFMIRDQDNDAFMLPSLTIPSRGYVVLARNATSSQNGGITADYQWPTGAFYLANASDEIEVVTPTGKVLDAIIYDNGATFPDPNGSSVERRDLQALPLASNFGEATSVFGAGDYGTPGVGNSLDQTGPFVLLTVAGPLTPGSTATFIVNGGVPAGSRSYILGLSECAEPGIALPLSGRVMDVCSTPLLAASIALPGFAGSTNVFGIASAQLPIPPSPALTGLTFHMTGIVVDGVAPEAVLAIMDNMRLEIN